MPKAAPPSTAVEFATLPHRVTFVAGDDLLHRLPRPPPEPHGLRAKIQLLEEKRAKRRTWRRGGDRVHEQRSTVATRTRAAAMVVLMVLMAAVLYMLARGASYRMEYWDVVDHLRAERCRALPAYRSVPSDTMLPTALPDEPTVLAAFDTIISDSPALRAYLSTSSTLGHDLRVELAFIDTQLAAAATTTAITNLKSTNAPHPPIQAAWTTALHLRVLRWERTLLNLLRSAPSLLYSNSDASSSSHADPALDLALAKAEAYHSSRRLHFQTLETTLGPVDFAFLRASKLWEMLRVAVESSHFQAQWQQQTPNATEGADSGVLLLRQLQTRAMDQVWAQVRSWKGLADQSAGQQRCDKTAHGAACKSETSSFAWTAEKEARCWVRIYRSLGPS
ncbi:hypothetical protein CBER1_10927 [Cercospora berteroae]|uniref:Uncharacterized protein n=1 Tax=Cercospora berteroae TaxID=357750 RepID=A0A2S6C9R4_9PEZI|nr:hypothetical protein CBER1_10927 [Cercospora berteroae]